MFVCFGIPHCGFNIHKVPLFFTEHLPSKVSVHATVHMLTVLTLTFTDSQVFYLYELIWTVCFFF